MGLYCVPREGAPRGTSHLSTLTHLSSSTGPFVYTLEDPQLMRYAVDTGDSIMVAQAPGAAGIAISDGVAYSDGPGHGRGPRPAQRSFVSGKNCRRR